LPGRIADNMEEERWNHDDGGRGGPWQHLAPIVPGGMDGLFRGINGAGYQWAEPEEQQQEEEAASAAARRAATKCEEDGLGERLANMRY